MNNYEILKEKLTKCQPVSMSNLNGNLFSSPPGSVNRN